ncbi:hypothetical protein GGS23DRAFT_433817 [Durotheca rogersii]|uniref:uncharacterized protein n=1 Tax=Durotheca rogersii TaxID=419775 RepID=UPI00221FEFB9|nr:uncharacterized protein GGS23DRAFT_433817 [Durotheca rogersii]KAI5865576.1 hypothetical protein GGS23DRAFT_433817 [Durotheca rogersii]
MATVSPERAHRIDLERGHAGPSRRSRTTTCVRYFTYKLVPLYGALLIAFAVGAVLIATLAFDKPMPHEGTIVVSILVALFLLLFSIGGAYLYHKKHFPPPTKGQHAGDRPPENSYWKAKTKRLGQQLRDKKNAAKRFACRRDSHIRAERADPSDTEGYPARSEGGEVPPIRQPSQERQYQQRQRLGGQTHGQQPQAPPSIVISDQSGPNYTPSQRGPGRTTNTSQQRRPSYTPTEGTIMEEGEEEPRSPSRSSNGMGEPRSRLSSDGGDTLHPLTQHPVLSGHRVAGMTVNSRAPCRPPVDNAPPGHQGRSQSTHDTMANHQELNGTRVEVPPPSLRAPTASPRAGWLEPEMGQCRAFVARIEHDRLLELADEISYKNLPCMTAKEIRAAKIGGRSLRHVVNKNTMPENIPGQNIDGLSKYNCLHVRRGRRGPGKKGNRTSFARARGSLPRTPSMPKPPCPAAKSVAGNSEGDRCSLPSAQRFQALRRKRKHERSTPGFSTGLAAAAVAAAADEHDGEGRGEGEGEEEEEEEAEDTKHAPSETPPHPSPPSEPTQPRRYGHLSPSPSSSLSYSPFSSPSSSLYSSASVSPSPPLSPPQPVAAPPRRARGHAGFHGCRWCHAYPHCSYLYSHCLYPCLSFYADPSRGRDELPPEWVPPRKSSATQASWLGSLATSAGLRGVSVGTNNNTCCCSSG